MFDQVRYLLLQVRNADDPMREHEVESFARVLHGRIDQISVFDLLSNQPHGNLFEETDVFLLGGSGHYSVASEGDWLERALEIMREVHGTKKPTFASCWGFQAMARAMGGKVVNDLSRAEVGTHSLFLTDAGKVDPVFGPLGESFWGQMGHEDCVVELPPETTLLASSNRVTNQAYRFNDRPIYCTQFHPELARTDLLTRVETYPEYVEKIAGMPPDEFKATVRDTTETEQLLVRFVSEALGE